MGRLILSIESRCRTGVVCAEPMILENYMENDFTALPGFESFGLEPALLRSIENLGYEKPTDIQAQTISPLLAGQDLIGQAQTGTGKTAAFALPLLNSLDVKRSDMQILVLTPTRELAIQVSEAFGQLAKYIKGVKILPVYGGADIGGQLRTLKKGIHIVVGTPGRVMDHMRRNTLKLDAISCIVLDEADEMLRMGFQEDVEWILEQAPEKRQMALFSATIPPAIRRIARRFMHDPVEITIQTKTSTVETLHQRYWLVSGVNKLDALSRILEVENYDGVIVFVRTRADTVELSEKLIERGFNVAPLSGDIPQNAREQTIDRLKAGKVDILVATDVAARGLDVDRISHVINYDVPHDAEAYIHRVGRTGRAGRNGEAIIFITPRNRGMLRVIENATRQQIEELKLPGAEEINEQRIASFKQKIIDRIEAGNNDLFKTIVKDLQDINGLDPLDIAAAAAGLFQGEQPLLLPVKDLPVKHKSVSRSNSKKRGREDRFRERSTKYQMVQYRVEVGLAHGVKAGNLLGAIANEAGLDGRDIGKIIISDEFSTIDLPEGMPSAILYELKKVRVAGKKLRMTLNTNPVRVRRGRKSSDSGKRRKSSRMRRDRMR